MLHCYAAQGTHTHTHNSSKSRWLSCCWSTCSINFSECLTASLSLCLSVSLQQPCVITVCQFAYNARMSANLCLSSLSLCQPTFTSFPGCLSIILPSCWRIISGELFYEDMGTFVCDWEGMQVIEQIKLWQADTRKIFHRHVITWNTLFNLKN